MKSAIGKWFAKRTRVSVIPGVAPVRYCLPRLDQYRNIASHLALRAFCGAEWQFLSRYQPPIVRHERTQTSAICLTAEAG
jgi:hypothetical protein